MNRHSPDWYLRDPNVLGYAYTKFKRIRDRVYVVDRAIVFFVRRKLPPSAVHPQFLIPKELNGYVTDVVEVYSVQGLGPLKTGVQQERVRPLRMGVSGAAATSSACTIGALVEYNGQYYLLTNAHCTGRADVSCELGYTVGNEFLQPSPFDGGVRGRDTVGRVAFATDLTKAEAEYDIGLVLPDATLQVEPVYHGFRLAPVGMRDPQIGERVIKIGRTTGFTRGIVYGVSGVVKTYYGACGSTVVKNAWVTTAMIDHGDSGSAVLTEDGELAGLFFATSSQYSFFHPASVLQRMGIKPAALGPVTFEGQVRV